MLFNEVIFGPIHSRRLGVSLGINLLPVDGKVCSFDCIYCECGYNSQGAGTRLALRDEVKAYLEQKLIAMKEEGVTPDVFTFAGNGEPTLHPQFAEIMEDTFELRNRYFPNARISVLSNATRISNQKVFETLLKVDNNILKLDGGTDRMVRLIDVPNSSSYTIEHQVQELKKFEGKFIMQTMFLRGTHNGEFIDNTTPEELEAWYKIVLELKPQSVMIYSLDRPTPEKNLSKVSREELEVIAKPLIEAGISVSIA
ncbi:MAG: radical SAM protein [Bacteroidales bacterium]